MSTRCNIHFKQWGRVVSNVYRHSDGYPGDLEPDGARPFGVVPDLLRFFNELRAAVPDNRLGVAEQLAGRFIVWQAKELAVDFHWETQTSSPKHYLDFLGVSPCLEDHGDIEYVYEVDCDDLDAEGCPSVRWRPAGHGRFRKRIYFHGEPETKRPGLPTGRRRRSA